MLSSAVVTTEAASHCRNAKWQRNHAWLRTRQQHCRSTGLLRLGISTDAARAKQQEEGRKLSQTLFNGFAVDGIL